MDNGAGHFPSDIKLKSSPLIEAWLEIHWKLQRDPTAGFLRDPGFPFALGVFYSSVKDDFEYKKDLDASRAPEEMLPHLVRHQFRPGEEQWPLLQLGPGVATVNFAEHYTWQDFLQRALYLRSRLLNAYGETALEAEKLVLRYRNGVALEPESKDLLDYFEKNLNTVVTLPAHIPGPIGARDWPVEANILFKYNLLKPRGVGTLRLVTGNRKRTDQMSKQETKEGLLVWQLGVESDISAAPDLKDEDVFTEWLNLSHAVIHEWFFSLIEGPLRKKYEAGEQ